MNAEQRWWELYRSVEERIESLSNIKESQKQKLNYQADDPLNRLRTAMELHDTETELFSFELVKQMMNELEESK